MGGWTSSSLAGAEGKIWTGAWARWSGPPLSREANAGLCGKPAGPYECCDSLAFQ
jgi:hypothetical protein